MTDNVVKSRFSNDLLGRLDDMEEDRDLNESQALRQVADVGLTSLGYTNGADANRTWLSAWLHETGKAVAYFGAGVIGATLFTGIDMAWEGVLLLLFAVLILAIEGYEPQISQRMGLVR